MDVTKVVIFKMIQNVARSRQGAVLPLGSGVGEFGRLPLLLAFVFEQLPLLLFVLGQLVGEGFTHPLARVFPPPVQRALQQGFNFVDVVFEHPERLGDHGAVPALCDPSYSRGFLWRRGLKGFHGGANRDGGGGLSGR
jgi:hypothetical protein